MGRPKEALALQDGRTLLETAVCLMQAVTDDVVIAGRPSAPVDVRVIEDEAPGEGPLAAVASVMRTHWAERYIVLACDMPRMTANVLRGLIDTDARLAAYRTADDRLQPLPLLIDHVMSDRIDAMLADGVRSLHRLLSEPGALIVPTDASVFDNVNTPEDFSRLASP